MGANNETVSRVVRRRAKPGAENTYEALVKHMLEASSRFPGYLSATIIPPHSESDNSEYRIVQRFASQLDLDRWDRSLERAMWHDRILPVAETDPAYHSLNGLEVWFPSKPTSALPRPPRWKMTTVSWLGIFPTVAVCLGLIAPHLGSWPFLIRTAVITALVAILMSYVVMPRLSRWMNGWLAS